MAEISAWDIYWVLQLDSIGAAVFVLAGLFAGGAFGLALTGYFNLENSRVMPELPTSQREAVEGKRQLRAAKAFAFVAIPFVALSALIPSSKTAAAMYVIPAVANNETLRKEAGELYGLAKDALKDAIGHEEKSK